MIVQTMKKLHLIFIISILFLSPGLSLYECYAQEEKNTLNRENPFERKEVEPLEGKEESTEEPNEAPALDVKVKEIEGLGIGTEEQSKNNSERQVVAQSNAFIQAIEFSIDYLKLTSTLLPFEDKAEGAVSILFKKNIMLTFEGGYGELKPRSVYKNSNYTSTGLYGRLGLDYVVPFDAKNNMIFGVRYGQSRFEDRAEWHIDNNELWGSKSGSFHRPDLTAHWAELIFASEAKFRNNFYYGFIFRFRMLIDYDKKEPSEISTFNIPGYGRTIDRTIPALNLFIKYKIPF